MSSDDRLARLFIYHGGERVDLVAAPPRSGKTRAVRAWLDSAAGVADQIWLRDHTERSLRELPLSPSRPTFAVLDDYRPNTATDDMVLRLVEDSNRNLHFVVITDRAIPDTFLIGVERGKIRLTTHADLTGAVAATG